jgi:hypothetical protein
MIFSADETADVGVDDATPVTSGEVGAATKVAAAQAGAESVAKQAAVRD